MAINIQTNYLFNSTGFLDYRQGNIAKTLKDLKNWNFDEYPIPSGFEVCVEGTWYTYNPLNPNNETSGRFVKRTASGAGFGEDGMTGLIFEGDTVGEVI